MTTRSGKIITPLIPIMNEDPKKMYEEQKEDPKMQTVDSTRRVVEKNSTSPRSEQNTILPLKPYQPPLPFPSGARQEK